MRQQKNMFSVVRRLVPAHGVKIGCGAREIATGLFEVDARMLADRLQAENPDEEYAVTQIVYRYWTKSQEG